MRSAHKTRLTADDYRACAKQGLTMQETAQRLGKPYDTVRSMACLHKISFVRARHGRQPVEDLKIGMVRLLKKGPRTIGDIGTHMGIAENTVRNHLRVLERIGFAHIVERIHKIAIWGLVAAPQASGAITMPKTSQTPSGGALVGGKRASEGKA